MRFGMYDAFVLFCVFVVVVIVLNCCCCFLIHCMWICAFVHFGVCVCAFDLFLGLYCIRFGGECYLDHFV